MFTKNRKKRYHPNYGKPEQPTCCDRLMQHGAQMYSHGQWVPRSIHKGTMSEKDHCGPDCMVYDYSMWECHTCGKIIDIPLDEIPESLRGEYGPPTNTD